MAPGKSPELAALPPNIFPAVPSVTFEMVPFWRVAHPFLEFITLR
jgi:hypothetical protein